MKIARRLATLTFYVGLCASAVRAQTVPAQLTGVVTDVSGAIIPNAEVTATNIQTGVKTHRSTNNLGLYTITDLEPGIYQVQVQKTGFRTVVQSNIQLSVGQVARVDVALTVGQVSESVEVNATSTLLQAEEASVGGVVDNTKISNLPLNGRDPYALIALLPGAQPQGLFFTPRVLQEPSIQTNFTVNGGADFTNEILIDGTPNVVAEHGQLAFTPSEDSVQEFRLLSSTYSAEYGRSGGAVVLIASKAGTNQFHGTAYEFLRNTVLDANDFFDNRSGVPRQPYIFNQYGGAIGGPVWLPHIYNGHNKTFFFFSFDGSKVRQAKTDLDTVPTALERAGDFSQTFNAQGQLVTIYDPNTTQQTSTGTYVRTPFPGNKIPANRLDPVALHVSSYYPPPDLPGQPFTSVDNFISTASQADNLNTYQGRVDHYFSERNHLFARYSFDEQSDIPANFFHNIATSYSFGPSTQPDHSATLSDTHVFSPNLLLEVRAGYTSNGFNRSSESAGFDLTQLGFPAALNNEFQVREFPSFSISGMGIVGPFGTARFLLNSEVRSTGATLTYIHGRHNVRIGAEWRIYLMDAFFGGSSGGSFSFNAGFTQGPNPAASSTAAGFGFASFLLGATASGTAKINARETFATKYYAGFVQDDFHVSSKLTLNLGLRYDYETPRTDRFNNLDFFNPTVSNPIGQQVGLPGLRGGLEYVGVNGNPREQANPDRNNFAPRFGFAYNVTPKTVIRGGYGILFLPNGTEHNPTGGQDGFSVATTQVSATGTGFTPLNLLSNPFPNGLLQPTGSSQGPLTLLGQSVGGFLRNMPVPYAQQFNFNIQRQLPAGILLEVAYVGSRGVKLPITYSLNQLPDRYLPLGNALLQQVQNPFYGVVTSGTLSNPTINANQLLRPFPQYTGVTYSQLPGGSSTYHSLQIRAERRLSSGLTILGAYTKAKFISNVYSENGFAGDVAATVQDSNNLSLERSLSPQDVAQRLVLSSVYNLPFGPGKRWLNGTHGVTAKLTEGWRISGIATLQSGEPLYLTTSVNNINGFTLASRPNNDGQSAKLSNPTPYEWFNTSVFSLPAPFTYGTTGRTLPDVRSAGVKNLDFSLIKDTRIQENTRMEFRVEVFNLLNTPQFGIPGTALGAAAFGVVSSQANPPRELQLALKLLF
ncbi:MAG TPA: TonB-dependent receptor [Bryobacteraceae bacterium]|nr:TonB-dependent receptor [Bryobacteraceae bacterium]